jgi:hypothetical protein
MKIPVRVSTVGCLLIAGRLYAGSTGPSALFCPTAPTPLQWYIDQGATGCTIGGFTYSGFQFAVQPGSTAPTIAASAVTVQPAGSSTVLGIRFSSHGFQVSGSDWAGYWLSYSIDPPPVIIRGFEDEYYGAEAAGSQPPIIRGGDDLQMAPALVAGLGSVTISTDLCVGGLFTGGGGEPGCAATWMTLSVYETPGGNRFIDSATFPILVNTLGVHHSIVLDGGGPGGYASFWALDNRAFVVPEPAAWLLGGCGLLALLLLRRRAA